MCRAGTPGCWQDRVACGGDSSCPHIHTVIGQCGKGLLSGREAISLTWSVRGTGRVDQMLLSSAILSSVWGQPHPRLFPCAVEPLIWRPGCHLSDWKWSQWPWHSRASAALRAVVGCATGSQPSLQDRVLGTVPMSHSLSELVVADDGLPQQHSWT